MVVPISNETPSADMEATGNVKFVLPLAFDLIENRQWNALIERIKTNPSDASFVLFQGVSSAQGNMALHEACKNQPPLKVVETLLEANPEAIKTKGRWGYLPLHYACSSGASGDVVSKLIKAYPTATRIRDESNEILPIHLAAKWGAFEDVIMAMLTTYPEGCFLRDASGKTPMDHAKLLPMPIRGSVLRALDHGPILCAVSKAAMERLEHENNCRIRGMADAHSEHVSKLQRRHEEEMTKANETEDGLRRELMEVQTALEYVTEKFQFSEKRAEQLSDDKDSIIKMLENQIKKIQMRFEAQGKELNALLVLAEDKVESLENQLAGKQTQTDALTSLVTELTENLDAHRNAKELMVLEIAALEKEKLQTQKEFEFALKESDKLRATGVELNKNLMDSVRKIQTYELRMEKVQKWASMFAYSMQTWSAEVDWMHRYSAEDKLMDSIADNLHSEGEFEDHLEPEKSLPATDTDESSMESGRRDHPPQENQQDDDNLDIVDDATVPTHV